MSSLAGMKSWCYPCTRCRIILTQLLHQQHISTLPTWGPWWKWMYWVGSQSHHPSVERHFQVAHYVHLMCFPCAAGRREAIKQDITKHFFNIHLTRLDVTLIEWHQILIHEFSVTFYRPGSQDFWKITRLSCHWAGHRARCITYTHTHRERENPWLVYTYTAAFNLELSFNLVCMSLDCQRKPHSNSERFWMGFESEAF